MKIKFLILSLTLSYFSSCALNKGDDKEIIISRKYTKKNKFEIDTLWVSQNDTTVFKQVEHIIHRPCSSPELTISYELINPKNESYYYIHNSKGKLVMEGVYTKEFMYEGIIYKVGDFYNSKRYYYKKSGKLQSIYYQKDGRNLKTEIFDRNEKLAEIIYFDKKSSDKTKTEIYSEGQLKETRIYTSFYNYYTIKENTKKYKHTAP